MRGAARAIGWELSRHHRLGLAILGTYVLGFWAIKTFVLGPEVRLRFDPPNGLAGCIIAPLSIAFVFLVGAFSYGMSGDLSARESSFPKRMFTLPVGTLTLVGWPMLYGTFASVTLWIVLVLLVQASGGADIPVVWPALALAAFLAWMQALTWLSYPFRAMRLVVAILALVASDMTVVIALEFHARESTMVAILAPQIAAAYVVGYWAVLRARKGDVPDWSRWFSGPPALSRQLPFSTPFRAQVWLEFRQHGRTLPAMVLFVLPWELLLMGLHGDAGMILFMLVVALFTPPALAMLAAPALSAFSTHAATRPLSSAQLVAAKIGMTLWSTLAAWVLAFILIAATLLLSGNISIVVGKLEDFAEVAGTARAIVVTMLFLLALVAATWKNLVQSLCIGLSGKPWIVKSSALLALVLITAAFPLLWAFLSKYAFQSLVWESLPWILVTLVGLKVSLAAWAAIRLHDDRILGPRAIVAGAAAWLVAVALVYGVLRWIVASPMLPFYFLASIAVLAVPIARLSAAPLALASRRHR